MTSRRVRILPIAALSLFLVAAATGMASPSPRDASPIVRASGAPSIGFAKQTRLLGFFSTKGDAYHWRMLAFQYLGPFYRMKIEVTYPTPGGQRHRAWLFRLPRGAVRVGPKLRWAYISTGSALEPHGLIRLTFHSTSTLLRREIRCPGTQRVALKVRYRTGVFRGDFTFKPRKGVPPDLERKSVRATASIRVPTGAIC